MHQKTGSHFISQFSVFLSRHFWVGSFLHSLLTCNNCAMTKLIKRIDLKIHVRTDRGAAFLPRLLLALHPSLGPALAGPRLPLKCGALLLRHHLARLSRNLVALLHLPSGKCELISLSIELINVSVWLMNLSN